MASNHGRIRLLLDGWEGCLISIRVPSRDQIEGRASQLLFSRVQREGSPMNSYEYDASPSGTHVGREGGRAGQLLCIFKREQETQGTQEHLL